MSGTNLMTTIGTDDSEQPESEHILRESNFVIEHTNFHLPLQFSLPF